MKQRPAVTSAAMAEEDPTTKTDRTLFQKTRKKKKKSEDKNDDGTVPIKAVADDPHHRRRLLPYLYRLSFVFRPRPNDLIEFRKDRIALFGRSKYTDIPPATTPHRSSHLLLLVVIIIIDHDAMKLHSDNAIIVRTKIHRRLFTRFFR